MVIRKKKTTQKEEIHNHYYPTNWSNLVKYIFIFVIGLIVSTLIFGLISSKVMENKSVYDTCAYSCSTKHFTGIKEGNDLFKDKCFVEEYDRTDCLDNCNALYYKLRSE